MAISLDVLDPGLRDAALELDAAVRRSGLQGRFTSTLRTSAEQTRLYRRFVAGQSQFPAVPPGASAHEYGLAFDYVVQPFSIQNDVGALCRSWGGGWSPTDAVHFELPGASAAVMQAYRESQGQEDLPWWYDVASAFLPAKAVNLAGTSKDYKSHVENLADEYLKSLGI
jgi:hypothetical protein